jgi:hypothetical protein
MGAMKDLWIELQNNVDQKVLKLKRKKFWVFRRYRQEQPNILSGKYKSIKDLPSPETWPIKESFALHFVEPFRTRKAAQSAINNDKYMNPWQEYFIIKS